MREEGCLSVEDALNIKSFPSRSQIGISPQGTHLTYALDLPNEDIPSGDKRNFDFDDTGCSTEIHQSTVWVTEIETGTTYQLGKPGAKCWSPEWSPDGTQVAYFSNETGLAQLWVWNLETQTSRRISDVVQRSLFEGRPHWCSGGTKLIIKALHEGLTVEEANDVFSMWNTQKIEKGKCTAVVYGEDNEAVQPPYVLSKETNDLVVVDLETGLASVLELGLMGSWFALSPDRKRLLYKKFKGQSIRDNHVRAIEDIVAIDLQTGLHQTLAEDLSMFLSGSQSWSPDGSKVAIEENTLSDHGLCHIVDLNTGERWSVGDTNAERTDPTAIAPIWTPDGNQVLFVRDHQIWKVDVSSRTFNELKLDSTLDTIALIGSRERYCCWSLDNGETVGALLRDKKTGAEKLAFVNVGTGESRFFSDSLQCMGYGLLTGMDVSADGAKLAYLAEDAQQPQDVWIYDHLQGTHRRITRANPQLEDIEQGQSRLVEWSMADGKKVQGALLLPSHYKDGQQYPTIVAFHPQCTWSRHLNDYGVEGIRGLNFTNMQLLATRGYAVFMPDVPHEGPTEMVDIAKAILPGIDMLIETGITDPERLGVIGQSEGGYGVQALIVQTTRFKAAVASAGHCDFIADCSQLINGGVAFTVYGVNGFGGTLWEVRDRYIENSPIFFFDKVETPVLLFAGGLDPRVPPHLVEQTYACLKYLQKPVVYVRYEGESHWPSHYSGPNVRDYTNRVIAWFDKYVKQAT